MSESVIEWIPELRATARRLSILAAALVCVACTTPTAQQSEAASATLQPTPTPSASATTVPTPSPTAAPSDTAALSPGPSAIADFAFLDILRVEVNGLAVRVSPSLSSPLAQGIERPGDVRLDAGEYVSVELGPLPIGDVVWYLVWPAEDARLSYSTNWWDTDGDALVGGVNPGWVAARVGADQYLSLYRPRDPSHYGSWPVGGPKTLMVSGTGDYVSDPHMQHDLFDLDWAAAVQDQSSPCTFSVTLLPQDGGEPLLLTETSIADVEQGPVPGPAGLVHTPWAASAGDPGDPLFTVSVRSGCAWAMKLTPLPHD